MSDCGLDSMEGEARLFRKNPQNYFVVGHTLTFCPGVTRSDERNRTACSVIDPTSGPPPQGSERAPRQSELAPKKSEVKPEGSESALRASVIPVKDFDESKKETPSMESAAQNPDKKIAQGKPLDGREDPPNLERKRARCNVACSGFQRESIIFDLKTEVVGFLLQLWKRPSKGELRRCLTQIARRKTSDPVG